MGAGLPAVPGDEAGPTGDLGGLRGDDGVVRGAKVSIRSADGNVTRVVAPGGSGGGDDGEAETTTITYELVEAQQVRLSVWNLAGHLITVLASQVQAPGTYEVQFEADDLPSGTYFVRLETAQGMESHKMILTK